MFYKFILFFNIGAAVVETIAKQYGWAMFSCGLALLMLLFMPKEEKKDDSRKMF